MNSLLEQALNVLYVFFVLSIWVLLCHLVAKRAVRTGLYYKPYFWLSILFLPYVAIYVFFFRTKRPINIGIRVFPEKD